MSIKFILACLLFIKIYCFIDEDANFLKRREVFSSITIFFFKNHRKLIRSQTLKDIYQK